MMLLDASLRATVVIGLIALLLAGLRVRASAARHAAWTAALLGMLLMPVLPRIVPEIDLQLPAPAAAVPAERAAGRLSPDAPSSTIASPAASGPLRERAVTPAPTPAAVGVPPRPLDWRWWLQVAYVCVCLLLAGRIAIGWWRAAAIGRRSVRAGEFFESDLVVAPVTVGVFAPRIILPLSWRTWPEETLQNVLLHERTHIRRRDPLVALLARVNACVFWFHPLAWWLQRTLATSAEHACDDVVARGARNAEAYATVLLDQADAVRRNGGRLALSGVGMTGPGPLQHRIERLLARSYRDEISLGRQLTLAACCAAAIFVVAACRQQPVSVPLREDPELAKSLAEQKAKEASHRAAIGMTVAEASALEATLEKNPEDLTAREKLMIFYRWSGKASWENMLAARRRHLLWLIEHHPEHQLTNEWGPVSPTHDPAGAAEVKALWLRKTASRDTPAIELSRAAAYFQHHDRELSEQMIVRAMAADPEGRTLPGQPLSAPAPWSSRLGELYARAIVGMTDPATMRTDPAAAKMPFAVSARKKLESSGDARLLRTAGSFLIRLRLRDSKLDFDPVALGRSYLERALQIDPQASQIRALLADLDRHLKGDPVREKIRATQIELAGGEIARKAAAGERLTEAEQQVVNDFEEKAALALPAAEQLAILPALADGAYMHAEYVDFVRKDRARAEALWARSKKFAQEALAIAETFKQDPAYGAAVYRSKVALAAHALREGNKAEAVRLMGEAARAPRSEPLASRPVFGLDGRLVNYLLKEGERESVAEFLERSAQLRDAEKDRLLKDAAAIRQGVMPLSYQAMLARSAS